MAFEWSVFVLLLWKNFIVRKRHWAISFVLQIGIPLLIFGLTQISRDYSSQYIDDYHYNSTRGTYYFNDEYYPIITTEKLMKQYFTPDNLYFAPKNEFTENLMNLTATCLSFPVKNVKGFTSEEELLHKYMSMSVVTYSHYYYSSYSYKRTEAIIFKNLKSDTTKLKNLDYTIRPQFISSLNGNFESFEHFLQEQICLDQSFLRITLGNTQPTINISMQKMPSPAYKEERLELDDFTFTRILYAVVAVGMFLIQLNVETIYPANEKDSGVNVLMAMNGVKHYENLLSWLISGLLFSTLYIIPRVIFLSVCFVSKCQPFLHYGNAVLVIVMHLFNVLHLLSFGYHVSSYFSKSILRVLAKNFIYLGTCGLQIYLAVYKKNTWIPLMGIFFPNVFLFRLYEEIDIYEKKLEGIHWSNMFSVGDVNYSSAGSLGIMLIFSILGTLIHFFLALYVSDILPGKYGVAKHPLYFLKFFTLKKNSSRGKVDDVNYDMQDALFEPVPKDVYVPGIQIRNLKKSYFTNWFNQAKKHALNGISIDFYEGEITTLLGHNGAGKTTMMSILTGLLSSTEGTIFINGKNIAEDMNEIVTDLGLCPQEDILFPDLNVFEQLQFFCMLKNKNKTKAQAKIEVESLLQRLKIIEKKDELPAKLSGGQKRRVCLGMSIISDASTLILDEPTSGMDPETRREVWDILLKMRGEKTILISTHNMEEADILGDRTAIIELGKLKSYGTPLFLKKHFGEGNMEITLSVEEVCDVDEITRQLPEESRLINSDGGKMVFSVPFTDQLPDDLDKIEELKEDLGVTGISVSLITLEQVFLRATKEDNDKLEENNFSIEKFDTVEGYKRFLQSFIALIMKKCKYVRKNIITHLLMIVIPIISIFMLQATFNDVDVNHVSFRLDMYNNPQVFYSSNDDDYGQKYKKVVENLNGEATSVSGNITEAIMKFGKEDYSTYRDNLIGGAEFNIDNVRDVEANVLFSKFIDYSAPITINLVSNTILKKLAGDEYQIDVSRQVLPNDHSFRLNQDNNILNYVRALLLVLCLSPTFALYVIQPLNESITGLKDLQRMTGVTSCLYWGSCFLFDLLFFMVTIIIYLIGFHQMDINRNLQLFHGTELSVMFLLLVLFSFNMLPFVYIFSFWKKKTNVIVTVLTLLPLLFLALDGITYSIIAATSRSWNKTLERREIEKKFFMLIPSVSFFYGQHSFFETAMRNANCRKIPKFYLDMKCQRFDSYRHQCCDLKCSGGVCAKYFEYFNDFEKEDSLKDSILYLCLTGFLYFMTVVILEHKLIQKFFIKIKGIKLSKVSDSVDDQVKAEKIFVASEISKFNKTGKSTETRGSTHRYNLFSNENGDNRSIYLAYELSKYYGSLAAVKEISFSVKKSECFGLLGVNGAGKSTTFRLLTGEEFPNSGIMYLNGQEISKNRREYLAQMGYCPQNSALLKSLDSEDHLKLFALLRGVPSSLVPSEVEKWIKRLKLNLCANQPSGTYSGGNKRRLSIAIALIGNPNLALMDEPTTGVDPAARRYMWHVIKSCQLGGQSIILTSHSMEECEALCNRLVIMVNGHFACIGPSEQLKQKFGAGFDINVKLNPERTNKDVQEIKKYIEKSLECEQRDEHVGYVTYHITDPRTKWRTMYDVMQHLKEKYSCIEDFSILSATLEQLFLKFARADDKPLSVQV